MIKYLLAVTLIVALAGCQAATNLLSGANPALSTYRDGLHAVDEPIYNQSASVMADAVKAGIRTPNDQQSLSLGISQARALYLQGAPTTQPAK